MHIITSEQYELIFKFTNKQNLKSSDDSECSICGSEYEEDSIIADCACTHKFHTQCLKPWVCEQHATCPLCRYDFSKMSVQIYQMDGNVLLHN